MTERQPTNLIFPRLGSLELRRFSLFSASPTHTVAFNSGVFCLAGANGIGKSTFLQTLNFATTGIVPEPDRKFESVEEHYKYNLPFASEYFAGRIEETDREVAEIILEMSVGETSYRLVRSPFEVEELRELVITRKGKDEVYEDVSPSKRHEIYAETITADIGLASFEQFVFLQHFVLTFDERRHLLFWDERVLTQAMFLAFGVDREQATKADSLRRDAEKADSLARNANWQATQVRKRIRDLKAAADTAEQTAGVEEDLENEHRTLLEQYDREESTRHKLDARVGDANLKLAEASAEHVALRAEYAAKFSDSLMSHKAVGDHVLVADTLTGGRCGICGAEGEAVVQAVRDALDNDKCPLCGATLDGAEASQPDLSALKDLDQKIARARDRIVSSAKEIERLKADLSGATDRAEKCARLLKDFEKKNEELLHQLRIRSEGNGQLDAILQGYEEQLQELLESKANHYKRRDEKRKALGKLQGALAGMYKDAETVFVPLFGQLAEQFLGLDLSIRLTSKESAGVSLVLDVRGSSRRSHHQLSESQRFFVDIALRMALAQFMSSSGQEAPLLLDTPEGSLDIAYESRAGNMLATFVGEGHPLIMTANINTSRLLLSLAEQLSDENMHVCRMTSWTDLSDVQMQEAHLFEEAFTAIQQSLGGKGSKRNAKSKARGK